MINQYEFTLSPASRGFHLITNEIMKHLKVLPQQGILNLIIQHTSAALTINENADPDVRADMNRFTDHLIPENLSLYEHIFEGADDMPAHIKSSIYGQTLTIPITNHKLNLGTWQGIYLCEFRNFGGSRKIVATIYS